MTDIVNVGRDVCLALGIDTDKVAVTEVVITISPAQVTAVATIANAHDAALPLIGKKFVMVEDDA